MVFHCLFFNNLTKHILTENNRDLTPPGKVRITGLSWLPALAFPVGMWYTMYRQVSEMKHAALIIMFAKYKPAVIIVIMNCMTKLE